MFLLRYFYESLNVYFRESQNRGVNQMFQLPFPGKTDDNMQIRVCCKKTLRYHSFSRKTWNLLFNLPSLLRMPPRDEPDFVVISNLFLTELTLLLFDISMHPRRSTEVANEASFQVYIFKQDMATLNSWASIGGSLFGLWTSTGNPVVHVVLPNKDGGNEQTARIHLEERYKMNYLGKWRAVATKVDQDQFLRTANDMALRENKRFLVLVVGRTVAQIIMTPYLFEDRQMQVGSIQLLEGPNPFIDDPDTKRILSGSYQPTGYTRNHQDAYEARHDLPSKTAVSSFAQVYSGIQEAHTVKHQWYSGMIGEEKLRYVFEEFKKIAERNEVQMNRDKVTQDFLMSFSYRGRQWQIEFSTNFPAGGAKLMLVLPTTKRSIEEVQSNNVYEAVREIIIKVRCYR